MTPSKLNTHTFRLRTRRQYPTIKMQYRLWYSHQNLASVLTVSPDIRSRCSQLINAIQTSNILASTLKVLKGSALRGGYCHELEYFHFITTILTSILNLSIYFPPNYSSYVSD